jgi:molybdenum cofactor cytidylyltransferase
MTHGVIILAAGASTRYGSIKQLLPYKGSTLVQHSIHEALATEPVVVIVVLGAHAEVIAERIKDEPVQIAYNPDWVQGMGTSIGAGIAALKRTMATAAEVLIMVCDQPYVSRGLLGAIIARRKTSGKGIVACSYNSVAGVPVLFSQQYFDELSALSANGAKGLLLKHGHDLAEIDFPLGSSDIDTVQDYEQILEAE